MKAIVLAAGLGGRMWPLTERLHKSLLSVGDTTILGRIVDGLLAIGVRDILVVTGYLAEQVRGALHERYPHVPFQFVHNEHPGTTFLVDESFIEFSGETPLRERLEREPLDNVVILASLSKSLGVPGLRLGYAYTCDRALCAELGGRVPVWNLGAPAEFLLELLLKFRPELAASFERTAADRADFAERSRGVAGVRPCTRAAETSCSSAWPATIPRGPTRWSRIS